MKKIKYIGILIFVISFFNCSSAQNTITSESTVEKSNLIPENVSKTESITEELHPLSEKINAFIKNQDNATDFKSLGLKRVDYLKIIEKQVRAMLKYQNSKGRIIDPVEKSEKYYTTPCFAHSVATLVVSGHIKKTDPLFESGVKALSESLSDMVNDTVNGNHGDFYTWPVMLAYENFKSFVSKETLQSWNKSLQAIDISKLYEFYNKERAMNWILVHSSGEFLRSKNSFTSEKYFERMLGFQLPNFTKLGMYNEGGNPLSYDLFARHYLAGVLQLGYKGKHAQVLQNNLWKGAWTSLFMQSPFGELPTGYRSSHHIWNEAEQCVLFEIYAAAYAKQGKQKEAGTFKRAALLSLKSIKEWIREDGSGYIVKNRFPIQNKHGYERYSVHTCYNMLATSMLAQAWQFSDDSIKELPSPADTGGFVIPILKPFHKIFANANGTYLEYETQGDQKYNPTGIIRAHIKGGHPQLGPSNGIAPLFSGEGTFMATGPLWQNPDGSWESLAEQKIEPFKVQVLSESEDNVKFSIAYNLGTSEKPRKITETISIKEGKIIVETDFEGFEGKKRISWPMLVNDGKNEVAIQTTDSSVSLELQGKKVQFTVMQPQKSNLTISNDLIKHINGMVKGVFTEFSENKIIYRLQ